MISFIVIFFFFSSRRRHTRFLPVSWARRCVQETAVVPFNYPLFKQCGESWSHDVMGSDGDTICQVGCLMTSVSMALNGHGWTLERAPINPGLLNTWLKQVGGYVSGSELVNSIICKLDSPYCSWDGFGSATYSRNQIIKNLEEKKVVMIAHVYSPYATSYPDHFVLVTGYDTSDSSFYYVHDPGFERSTYSLDRIAGFNIWTIDILNSI
eukprot:TRINITY_DN1417_c0_g1_i6.p1 TRINITY_DN1417_c0_g1~~TRINITY_DN1417_c0_g1_i6.p1  ORF type:complete len:210 (+),score=22.80 TRINITY_DN1417_c0_g1_i6:13-642(+)